MALIIVGMLPAAAPQPLTHVDVRFTDIRSSRGLIRACLTRDPAHFPHCEKDPASLKANIPARPDTVIQFTGVAPGDYAITVLHDENSNAKADMFLGIPREGVGFSQNPVLRMGPPKFAEASFHVGAAPVTESIQLKYFP